MEGVSGKPSLNKDERCRNSLLSLAKLNSMNSFLELPMDLPEPKNDGQADHLTGMEIPDIFLESTSDGVLPIRRTGRQIICFYPMTGIPGSALPGGWDSIPGARGCTPQLCSISDNYSFYEEEKIPIFGISTQYSKEQSEAKQRLKLRYELLSDVNRELQKTLSLPMFSIGTMSFYKRLTMVIDDDIINKVFYPIFPPDLHYQELLGWLKQN